MASFGNPLFWRDSKRLGLLFFTSAFIHLGLFFQHFEPLSQKASQRLLGKKGGLENATEVSFFPSFGFQAKPTRSHQTSPLEVSKAVTARAVSQSQSGTVAVKGIGQGGTATDYHSLLHAYLDSAKVYPRSLRDLGLSGIVRVRFQVSKEGYLENIQIAQSEAPQILQAEALKFLKKLDRVPTPPHSLSAQELNFELPLRYELKG